MNILIENYTNDPVSHIARCAGTCYGKPDDSEKRVKNCVKRGHLSVLEHACVTFRVEGVSRACMAQMTRHRMASFCVESQRYCRIDTDGRGWYVTPPELEMSAMYAELMDDAADAYRGALDAGIKPEDARYMLPEATKTNLVVTMNWRELFHFLDLRTDKAAQWEIRGMAEAMVEALEAEKELRPMVAMWKETR